MLLGEWGSPTRATTDGNPVEQARYRKVYQVTVNELDARSIGGIKAWFCGARKPIPVPGSTNWMTWAIFSDKSPAGRVERKYITDVIVRPRPLVVAGRLKQYGYDFTERRFEMIVETNPGLGSTEIFVPAERHYPQGFRAAIGPDLTLVHTPHALKLATERAAGPTHREQARLVSWDDDSQRLSIQKWLGNAQPLTLTILPREPV